MPLILRFKTFACLAPVFWALSAASFGQVPRFRHVFLVVEGNQSYTSVIRNPAMPYLNSLADRYGRATNYYANSTAEGSGQLHRSSIGNYFMLTTGELITSDDRFGGVVTDDNIVRELVAAGKTWKSYAESLPAVGYTD